MLGSEFIRLSRKSLHASARVKGGSVSQNRNTLSGRLSTKTVESSASFGGGRILRFSLLRIDWKSGWELTLSLSGLERKVKITRSGACFGEKKLWQLISRVAENQVAIMHDL